MQRFAVQWPADSSREFSFGQLLAEIGEITQLLQITAQILASVKRNVPPERRL